MLSVFIFDENKRYDSGLQLSLTVGGDDKVDQRLKEEFVRCFDVRTRKVGLNGIPYIHMFEARAALLAIANHRGLNNALFDLVSIIDNANSMDAVTIDYLF